MAPYHVFTSQNYPYFQKHSGVPWTEIATLNRAFFHWASGGVDGRVNPLGVNWGEAGGHRSKLKVVLALYWVEYTMNIYAMYSQPLCVAHAL